MIKMIDGVVVDSDVVPHSFALAEKAKAIATHFKQSVQDAIQELMYLELIFKEKKIKDLQKYLIASFYKTMLDRVRGDIRARNYVERKKQEGYFTDDEYLVIQNRIFVNEIVMILKQVDDLLSRILTSIRENLDKSLVQIYKMYYADELSQRTFFRKIHDLRKIISGYSSIAWRSCLRMRTELK